MTSPFVTLTRHPGRAQPRRRPALREGRLGERAREAERLRTALMHAALDAVVISGGDGRIVEVNAAAEAMFGRDAAAFLGAFMSDLILVPAAGDAAPRHRADTVMGVLGQRMTLEAVRADGTLFPAEIAVQRVSLGARTLFAAFVRDLTAERHAAAALDEERRRLLQVEKLSAMGALLAGVAHEINNPLAILVAQATLLRDKAPTPDVERRAERIHAAAGRAGRFVKNVLALASEKPLAREPTDLIAVLDDALELLGSALRSAGVAVRRAGLPSLPPVEADRDLMSQVFATLLINAQDSVMRRPGDRRIVLRAAATPASVTVEVEDNGGGVAPAIAGRLFEPYATTKPAGAGLGIGLSLCRSVLVRHGGSIAWRNTPEGAAFTVTLPRAGPAAHHAPVLPAAAGASPRSILVVDDEIDVATALAELIELFGHRVRVETCAPAVVGLLAEDHFDMIFTDFRMPGLDGIALRRAVAAVDPGLAARTVLMTGDTVQRMGGLPHPTTEPGALVLEKPFTAASVRALLDRVASR